MYDKKENIRQIRQSLDMMVYKRVLIAIAIGTGLGLLYGWFQFRKYEFVYFGIFLGWMALFLVPAAGFWGWKMWKLFREPEEYFFTQVKLASPHQKLWTRGMMYFTVVIDHPEEGTIAVNTNPVFASYGWEQPLLEDYLNKTVTVGYNRETGMVVVIG